MITADELEQSNEETLRRLQLRATVHINAAFLETFAAAFCAQFAANHPAKTLLDYARGCRYLPTLRHRLPAAELLPIGTVLVGPQFPDGVGETLFIIENRNEHRQRLRCVWDGRPKHATERGRTFTWPTGDNFAVFGRLLRGQLVAYRNQLRRRGILIDKARE